MQHSSNTILVQYYVNHVPDEAVLEVSEQEVAAALLARARRAPEAVDVLRLIRREAHLSAQQGLAGVEVAGVFDVLRLIRSEAYLSSQQGLAGVGVAGVSGVTTPTRGSVFDPSKTFGSNKE